MVDSTGGSTSGRVLVIGMDAGDALLWKEWSAQGELPALEALCASGAYAELVSMGATVSDAPWPTFATGLHPGAHGFYSFHPLRGGRIRPAANGAYWRPFWWQLRTGGQRAVIFDVPKVRVQPGLAGVQVVGWNEALGRVHASAPPGLLRQLTRRYGSHQVQAEDWWGADSRRLDEHLDKLMRAVERRRAATRMLLSETEWDLAIAVFAETHVGGHGLWPRPVMGAAANLERLEVSLRRIYQQVDAAIADLVATIDLATTAVLIISAHGIADRWDRAELLNPVLDALGYRVPGARGGEFSLTHAVRTLVPLSLRRGFNHFASEAMQDRILSELLAGSCDWERTTAFQEEVTGNPRQWVRVRAPGADGRAYEELCARLENDLYSLRLAPGGPPAVKRVVRCRMAFPGPHADELPDLAIEWAAMAQFDSVWHPQVGTIRGDRPVTTPSQHSDVGFVIAAGRGIKGGARASGHVVDLAPTILHLLGSPIPAHLEGQVLTEILAEPVRPRVVPTDASWQVDPWNGQG